MLATKPIQGFDVYHQIVRMKTSKDMLEQEVELIMRSLVENVQNYEQAVEVRLVSFFEKGGINQIRS